MEDDYVGLGLMVESKQHLEKHYEEGELLD